jgi:hypothetical protein
MTFGENKHPAYDHLDVREMMKRRHGSQAGDIGKGVKIFYDLAVMEDPPLRCLVGTDAYTFMAQKLEAYAENMKKFEEITNSTDIDGYVAPPNLRYATLHQLVESYSQKS